MPRVVMLAWSLLLGACSHKATSVTRDAPESRKGTDMTFTAELVAEIPWTPSFAPVVIDAATDRDEPDAPTMVRFPPALVRGADGTLWLSNRGGRVGPIRDGHVDVVPLEAADAGVLVGFAPAGDGGVVVLGRRDGENVLARLDAKGARGWRRTGDARATPDVAALAGALDGLQLDGAGNVYLVATTATPSRVARVDLGGGATPVVVDLGDYRADVRLGGDRLHRVVFRDGRRFHAARPLGGGADRELPLPAETDGLPATAFRPDPRGGVLIVTGTGFLRLGADGATVRAPLAGIVPTAGGVVVAVRDGAHLVVDGVGPGGATTRLGPFDGGALLVAAGPDRLLVRAAEAPGSGRSARVLAFTPAGAPLDGPTDDLLARESWVDVSTATVEPDGAVLVSGASPGGAYVVRLRLQ